MNLSGSMRNRLVLMVALMAVGAWAQTPQAQHHPARPGNGSPRPGPRPQPQQHLAQWMQAHDQLPLAEQQRALEAEPGFRQLPPETQQRMLDRLTQLNNMPPERRNRIMARTEMMEHLTIPQRQQVRGAMQQLRDLPVDRRRVVARTFRDLRHMAPPQRAAFLASKDYQAQFSMQERNALSSLLAVEPFLPPPDSPNPVAPGGGSPPAAAGPR